MLVSLNITFHWIHCHDKNIDRVTGLISQKPDALPLLADFDKVEFAIYIY